MLCRMDVYARKKHLIINTVKSEVVHFNCKYIWVRCGKGLFGFLDVMLGATYVNPISPHFPTQAVTDSFSPLLSEVTQEKRKEKKNYVGRGNSPYIN
eukprot:1147705-Pelagomonas_calceolata.AAC.1